MDEKQWYKPMDKIPDMTNIREYLRNQIIVYESDELEFLKEDQTVILGKAVKILCFIPEEGDYGAGPVIFEDLKGNEILIERWRHKNDSRGTSTED